MIWLSASSSVTPSSCTVVARSATSRSNVKLMPVMPPIAASAVAHARPVDHQPDRLTRRRIEDRFRRRGAGPLAHRLDRRLWPRRFDPIADWHDPVAPPLPWPRGCSGRTRLPACTRPARPRADPSFEVVCGFLEVRARRGQLRPLERDLVMRRCWATPRTPSGMPRPPRRAYRRASRHRPRGRRNSPRTRRRSMPAPQIQRAC